MRKEDTIVKVQTPLAGPSNQLLVYAEGKKMMTFHDPDEPIMKALHGDAKGYFKADWAGKRWIIRERVADQDW